MGEEASQLESHIEEQRSRLERNLREIESKAAQATDWRSAYRSRPLAALGLAFTGGFIASRLLPGRNKHLNASGGGSFQSSASSKSMGLLGGLQVAIVNALVQEARQYVARRFSGQERPPASPKGPGTEADLDIQGAPPT